MRRLNVEDSLFNQLSRGNNPPEWWQALMSDKDIIIQIRKDNSIDAYFNGGAIITGLKVVDNRFSGQIHIKYIPSESSLERGDEEDEQDNENYIEYNFNKDSIEFGQVKPIGLGSFSPQALKKIKARIKKYYSMTSEKGIQYSFIKNDPSFIDSELAYKSKSQKIRIDLVRLDVKRKKVVFIEVKRMNDARLDNNEIVDQLSSYQTFISQNKTLLLQYYAKVVKIKEKLGISLPKGLDVDCFKDEYEILEKPLLLFGDCTQAWINARSQELDRKIRPHAVGCYYFGKPCDRCDILERSRKNQHIY